MKSNGIHLFQRFIRLNSYWTEFIRLKCDWFCQTKPQIGSNFIGWKEWNLSVRRRKRWNNLIWWFALFLQQGNSKKFTGAFKFRCRVIFWIIYLSKSSRKSGLISLSMYWIHKKKYSYCFFYFITNINKCKFILINTFEWLLYVSFRMYIMTPVFVSYFKISSSTLNFLNKAVLKKIWKRFIQILLCCGIVG